MSYAICEDNMLDDMIHNYTDLIVRGMISRWGEWSEEPIEIQTWIMDPQTERTGIQESVLMASATTRHGVIAMGCGTDVVDALEALISSLLFLRSFGASDPDTETIDA
jgi:hypothetical protein|tara:strand:+ start:195 stop:518 length:324 start_codon:yes stop_codon:yes gene_type:complete